VECEIGQVALCYVENGQKRHICRTPPARNHGRSVVYWLYEIVTGQPVTSYYSISGDDIRMLLSGATIRRDGVVVHFTIPRFMRQILEEWRRDGGNNDGGISGPATPSGPGAGPGKRYSERGPRKQATRSDVRAVIGKDKELSK